MRSLSRVLICVADGAEIADGAEVADSTEVANGTEILEVADGVEGLGVWASEKPVPHSDWMRFCIVILYFCCCRGIELSCG